MSRVKNNLRILRKARKITLVEMVQDLSDQGIKMARSTLINYEKGERNPKAETWQVLADYFGVSVNYAMGVNQPLDQVRKKFAELDMFDMNEIDSEFERLRKNNEDNYDDEQLYVLAVKNVGFGLQHDLCGAIKLVMNSVEDAKFKINTEYRDYVKRESLIEITKVIDSFRTDLDRLKSELK